MTETNPVLNQDQTKIAETQSPENQIRALNAKIAQKKEKLKAIEMTLSSVGSDATVQATLNKAIESIKNELRESEQQLSKLELAQVTAEGFSTPEQEENLRASLKRDIDIHAELVLKNELEKAALLQVDINQKMFALLTQLNSASSQRRNVNAQQPQLESAQPINDDEDEFDTDPIQLFKADFPAGVANIDPAWYSLNRVLHFKGLRRRIDRLKPGFVLNKDDKKKREKYGAMDEVFDSMESFQKIHNERDLRGTIDRFIEGKLKLDSTEVTELLAFVVYLQGKLESTGRTVDLKDSIAAIFNQSEDFKIAVTTLAEGLSKKIDEFEDLVTKMKVHQYLSGAQLAFFENTFFKKTSSNQRVSTSTKEAERPSLSGSVLKRRTFDTGSAPVQSDEALAGAVDLPLNTQEEVADVPTTLVNSEQIKLKSELSTLYSTVPEHKDGDLAKAMTTLLRIKEAYDSGKYSPILSALTNSSYKIGIEQAMSVVKANTTDKSTQDVVNWLQG